MKGQWRSNEPTARRPLKEGGATNVDEQAAAKLIEGYPLPPPDDRTVQRIWQRVASAQESPTSASSFRLPGLLASSLALCLVVALGFVFLRGPARPAPRAAPVVVNPAPAAELAAAQGGVFFSRPAERWQPGEEGQLLAEGQSLRTDPNGQAVMDILGIASILVARGTDIAVERLSGGTFLRLSRGSVVARVSPRPASEPFFILTHRFSVKVVGTLFQVDQSLGQSSGQAASDRTAVSVREGVVEVAGADGHSWRIPAGHKWSSDSPERLGPSAIPDSIEMLLEDGLKRASPIDLDRELSALSENATPSSSPVSETVDEGVVPSPRPSPLEGDRGAARAGMGGGAGKAALRAAERSFTAPASLPPPPVLLATREPTPAPSEPSLESHPPTTPAPAAVSASEAAGGTYAAGLALERAGKIQAAAEEFIQAEKSDPAHAELALYALGRLRQHRLRDPQGALEAFETYRRRYPKGPLLPEVDLAVLEIDVAAGHRDQALSESERFLASHPASERLVEVHLLRGDLLRERGDCHSALSEYRQVDGAAFAEEALFETAYCQRKLGHGAAAHESLRQYQERYPSGTHRDEVAKALRE